MAEKKQIDNKKIANILFVVIMIVLYNYFLAPEKDLFFKQKEDIALMTQEIKLYKRLTQDTKNDESTKKEIANLKQHFVTKDEFKDILQFVAKTATETDVNLLSINSRPSSKKDFYTEVPFEINFDGHYSQVFKFMDMIENHSKKIDIFEIKIDTERKMPKLEVTLLLVTYRLN